VLVADLDDVDGPCEPRLVRVRRITAADAHASLGVEPALDFVLYVLASHLSPFPEALVPEVAVWRVLPKSNAYERYDVWRMMPSQGGPSVPTD
jgi:hypothetical protein